MAIQSALPANLIPPEEAESDDDIAYREAKTRPEGMTEDERIYFEANGYKV